MSSLYEKPTQSIPLGVKYHTIIQYMKRTLHVHCSMSLTSFRINLSISDAKTQSIFVQKYAIFIDLSTLSLFYPF